MKILVVEDEKDLRQSISAFLQEQGFLCEEAMNYVAAEDKLATYDYEVVVLDLTLPDGNGLNLLEHLKKECANTGVLIVSARNSIDDKIKGLDLGADDYITKPFHLAELNSRINAILRRRNFQGQNTITFGEIEITPSAKETKVNGLTLDLTKKEYDLLLYLIINKNRVLTKEALAEHLWGDHIDMVDNFDFIYTHIKNLRRKIAEKGGTDYLETVYGLGYKYCED